MKILVTGATGYVGGRLVPHLLERGHVVRVMVRDPARIMRHPWAQRVEVVRADVDEPETLPRALQDIDTAYYLIHHMAGGGGFADREQRAARAFVSAGRQLRHVIYLGGLVPDAEHVSEHLFSRSEVGRILREGLPTTEFRAGPIIGSGSASFEMVRYLTERLPAMIAPRWILNEVQPIAIRDVLAYLLSAIDRRSIGVVNIGTDRQTFKSMMEVFASIRGLRRVIVPVPVLAPRLAALWVGLVTPISNRLAVPLIEGVVHPVVADTGRASTEFPEVAPMPYRKAVEQALADTTLGAVATRWSDALGSAPVFELTQSEGLIRETRTRRTSASSADVFGVFSSLGGDRGWLIWNWAWKLRGAMDSLIGGPGLRRGRRHPSAVTVGDAIDFWRVEQVDPPHLLRLRAEMKVPGRAWFQWETIPDGDATVLVQSAFFEPVGLLGQLYWTALYPAHKIIFSAMVRRIAHAAESRRRS